MPESFTTLPQWLGNRVQLVRDCTGAGLVETRAVCENFADFACRTCLRCGLCRTTMIFFTLWFLIFTCLTADLALIGCVAGAGVTGAALCARTGAVNMVTAISAAATFLSITIS